MAAPSPTPHNTHHHHLCILTAGTTPDLPGTLHSWPLFTQSAGVTHGLQLLAAAATASKHTTTPVDPSLIPLAVRGPFNTAASLPLEVVKRILDLEFVEIFELAIDNDFSQASRRPPVPMPSDHSYKFIPRATIPKNPSPRWFNSDTIHQLNKVHTLRKRIKKSNPSSS